MHRTISLTVLAQALTVLAPAVVIPTIPVAHALVSSDGITGRLPAMGWNSWNEYGCNISEEVFVTVAERLVSLGLKDLGYEYVNIDDCWSDKVRRRDSATGELLPDYAKFPRGISHVAERVHALGLKLGIYGDAGTDTCGGYAGSLGFEELDAATFRHWGVDYLKYDNCNVPANWTDEHEYTPEGMGSNAPADYDWSGSRTARRYKAMGDALQQQQQQGQNSTSTIQYSLCAWGHAHVERWGNQTGHSWRMWGDIMPRWDGKEQWSWGLMPIVKQASLTWSWTDFWGRNDWDMLEVGNGNLTLEENRSHFAMWCALKSPLIIGTPLDGIDAAILGILSNRELIAFNQDSVYGTSARPYSHGDGSAGTVAGNGNSTHPPGYWVGTSVKGIHVFLLNTYNENATMSAVFAEIPGLLLGEYLVHDMWTGRDLGTFKQRFDVQVKAHDTAALRITTIDGKHPNPSWSPRSSTL